MCETKRTNLTNAYGRGKKIEKKHLSVQKTQKETTNTNMPTVIRAINTNQFVTTKLDIIIKLSSKK